MFNKNLICKGIGCVLRTRCEIYLREENCSDVEQSEIINCCNEEERDLYHPVNPLHQEHHVSTSTKGSVVALCIVVVAAFSLFVHFIMYVFNMMGYSPLLCLE